MPGGVDHGDAGGPRHPPPPTAALHPGDGQRRPGGSAQHSALGAIVDGATGAHGHQGADQLTRSTDHQVDDLVGAELGGRDLMGNPVGSLEDQGRLPLLDRADDHRSEVGPRHAGEIGAADGPQPRRPDGGLDAVGINEQAAAGAAVRGGGAGRYGGQASQALAEGRVRVERVGREGGEVGGVGAGRRRVDRFRQEPAEAGDDRRRRPSGAQRRSDEAGHVVLVGFTGGVRRPQGVGGGAGTGNPGGGKIGGHLLPAADPAGDPPVVVAVGREQAADEPATLALDDPPDRGRPPVDDPAEAGVAAGVVAELVGDHAAELAHVEHGEQRHPDGQHRLPGSSPRKRPVWNT